MLRRRVEKLTLAMMLRRLGLVMVFAFLSLLRYLKRRSGSAVKEFRSRKILCEGNTHS